MKVNRALTFAAFMLAVCGFFATGSVGMLFAALAIAILFLASGPVAAALARRTELALEVRPSCLIGDEHVLDITVTRPALMRGCLNLTVECTNLLLGTRKIVPVTLPPADGDSEHYALPLDTRQAGRIAVTLVSARAKDMLGFAEVELKGVAFSSSYIVYPRIVDLDVATTRANRAATAGFVFDPHRKGQDASEVFELRDYRDGDSVRSIHWKLSARFGDLMVREASHPADFDLAVFCALHRRDCDQPARTASIDAALSLLASISRALLNCGMGHSVVFRHDDTLQDAPIENQQTFERMIDTLLGCELPLDTPTETRAFAAFQRAHGITKVVLVTDTVCERLFEELGELCELNVFYVGGEGDLNVDVSSGYSLTRVSAEAVETRVKSLEL